GLEPDHRLSAPMRLGRIPHQRAGREHPGNRSALDAGGERPHAHADAGPLERVEESQHVGVAGGLAVPGALGAGGLRLEAGGPGQGGPAQAGREAGENRQGEPGTREAGDDDQLSWLRTGARFTTLGATGAPSASRSCPPTTTCSAASTPLRASTKPGVRTPRSTWRRVAFPWITTQTKLEPWSATMASSGMTTALGRTAVASRASMNMPDCSARLGLDVTALTVMVRPGSCTTGSTKSTRPVYSCPGSAATRKVTC